MNHEPGSPGLVDASEFAAGTAITCADALAIWSDILARAYVVERSFTEHCAEHLLLARAHCPAPAMSERNRAIFERMLLGDDRKAIAAELGVSTSTVAQVLTRALRQRGLACTPARAPLTFVMVAQVAYGVAVDNCLWLRRGRHADAGRLLLSANLEPCAWEMLAPAERAVVAERLLGRSYADIAAERRTSRRTVANQIAAVHRRSGQSGRPCLLQWIFRGKPAA
jgi:DNA-binding NarL/FixJ family response regulator